MTEKPITITANLIEQRLREKHASDLFISQCKTGGSWSGAYQILDAWVMKKSWAHPLTTGYEIKVSRADFLGDEKWTGYLPFCNEFYFVTPPKLVVPEELAEDVGLMWISSTGTRFFIKKKAKYREAKKIESLYKYILMSRTKIMHSSYGHQTENNLDYWNNWLIKEDEQKELGHNVSKKIRELVTKKINEVNVKNNHLESQIKKLEQVKEFAEAGGINLDNHWWSRRVTQQIENAQKLIPENTEFKLRDLSDRLHGVIEILDESKKMIAENKRKDAK